MNLDWTAIIIAGIPTLGGVYATFMGYKKGKAKKRSEDELAKALEEQRRYEETLEWRKIHEDKHADIEKWQEEHVCTATKAFEEIIATQKLTEIRHIKSRISDIHDRAVIREYVGFKEFEEVHNLFEFYVEELKANSYVPELVEHINKMNDGTFDYVAFKKGR